MDPPFAPYSLQWTHYGTIWHHMSLYGPIWAPFVLLWAPYDHLRALSDTSLTLYASLWAPYKPLWLNIAPYCPNGLPISPV